MTSRAKLAILVAAGVVSVLAAAGASADDAAAQKAFSANKCDNCHSIEKLEIERKIKSEKMAGPDLSTVGDRHDAEWITRFAMREVDQNGAKHKNEYKGTKEDLQAIAQWLAAMKSSG